VANKSEEPTVITRPSWANVIPQVAAEPTVRTESSATPCTRSSNVCVDSNNPASSDNAEPAGRDELSDTNRDLTRRPGSDAVQPFAKNGVRTDPHRDDALSTPMVAQFAEG